MADPDVEAVERELSELRSQSAARKAGALMQLGWSRAGQPTPGLEPFLDDPDLLVRIAAAQARWQTARDAGELDRLVGILVEGLSSESEDTALMAGTALVNMDEVAVAPLISSFAKRGERDALIVRVLGEIAGDDAAVFLRRVIQSSRPAVAEEARQALEAMAEEGY